VLLLLNKLLKETKSVCEDTNFRAKKKNRRLRIFNCKQVRAGGIFELKRYDPRGKEIQNMRNFEEKLKWKRKNYRIKNLAKN
jgi:hypothetical protein